MSVAIRKSMSMVLPRDREEMQKAKEKRKDIPT